MNKLVLKFHIIGFFVISIVGTLLHFAYEFFNNSYFIGLFSPINESVFEHLKMCIFPTLFFMIIEHIYLSKNNKYFLAKYLAIIFECLFIIFVFYTYTFFTKESILIIDILTFFISILLGQILAYIIMTKDILDNNKLIKYLNFHAKYLIVFLVLFVWFMTFYPFKIDLFEDKIDNTYGIFKEEL